MIAYLYGIIAANGQSTIITSDVIVLINNYIVILFQFSSRNNMFLTLIESFDVKMNAKKNGRLVSKDVNLTRLSGRLIVTS